MGKYDHFKQSYKETLYTVYNLVGDIFFRFRLFFGKYLESGMNYNIRVVLTDTGLSWSQNASCFFARQFPVPEKNIHLFQTFD